MGHTTPRRAYGRRGQRFGSVALAVALVATFAAGCTKPAATPPTSSRPGPHGSTAPVDPAAWALADRLTARQYTPDTTAALVAALARSGVATFTDPGAVQPEQAVAGSMNPLRLLDFQAHALAVGAWAGAGYTGAELDTVLPAPADAADMPTASEILAGYVAAARTPGAAVARALMAGQNLFAPSTLRFPALVLVLFVAELAADSPASAHPSAAAAAGPSAARLVDTVKQQAGGGICSTAAHWVEDTIVGFFKALRLSTPDNLPGAIAVSIWNWLVGAAQAFVRHLITALTDAVLGTIRTIAFGFSEVAEKLMSLLPYAVTVMAVGDSGGGATFTLGEQPQTGHFTAAISAGDLPDWPAVLADCAEVAKIRLPKFDPLGIPLTWGQLEGPADPLLTPTEPGHTKDVTDSEGRAQWGFVVAADPGDPTGGQLSQVMAMPVSVHRAELDQARDKLTFALLGSIPDLVRPYAARLLAPYLDGLQARVNVLLDARGRGTAYLVYHDGKRPTPTPAPAASGCGAGRLGPGTYTGTYTNTFVETIPMTGGATVDHDDATGPVSLTVAADGSVSGRWSYTSHQVFDEHAEVSGVSIHHHVDATWAMTPGALTGTVCDLHLNSGTLSRVACTGDCGDAPAPASQAALLPLGAPVSAGGGRATWRWQGNATDGAYTDTLTLTVG